MNKLKNIKNKLKLLVNKTNKDSVIPIFFATDGFSAITTFNLFTPFDKIVFRH